MTLLTTKQVQEIFRVDRSTIYRMAEDGRLPAVKVGRQWRFPSERVELLLGQSNPEALSSPDSAEAADLTLNTLLPGETAQAVADLAARDPMAAKVHKSFQAFYDGVRNYHHISEQAYINARDRVMDD